MDGNGRAATKMVLAVVDAKPVSFKVGVKSAQDVEWVYNALRFYIWEDANTYARDLLRRWSVIHSVAVHESEERPNATYPVPSDRYQVARRG